MRSRELGVSRQGHRPDHARPLFRLKDHGLQMIGIAQGQFPRKKLLLKICRAENQRHQEERLHDLTLAGGMQMTFLDDWTMLFGDVSAVKAALDARDNSGQT